MRRLLLLSAGLFAACGIVIVLSSPAESQIAQGLVILQPTSPGTAQIGHVNVSGKVISGEGFEGSAAGTTALQATSSGSGTIAGIFNAPDGYSTGVAAYGSWTGVFGQYGGGSGLTPDFPGSAGVVGDGTYYGIVGKTDSQFGGAGVVGNNSAGASISWFTGAGISGVSRPGGRGVAGSAGFGAPWGVLGTDAYGVTGQQTVNGGFNYGNLAGAYDGVYGQADANGGNGVQGVANVGGAAYGIWGRSSSGYAGVFSGTTSVAGNFYASAKFFRIDHPQDPENKYLIHACVESDQQTNIYRGTAYCNQKGEVWVDLPSYYSALNGDPGYQLTCVGGYAQIYVAEEAHNRFKIAGGKPGLKVCWTAYGTRIDPYVKAHPMVVEPRKEGEEAGKLLTPKEYGYPPEAGMTYEKEQAADNIPRPTSAGIMTRSAK